MNTKLLYITFGLLALFEGLSFTGHFFPAIQTAVFCCLVFGILIASLKDIRFGLLAAVAELAVGSQGYLFSFGSPADGISLRIAIWIIVMAVWATQTLLELVRKKTRLRDLFGSLPYAKPLLACAAVLGLGALAGFLSNDPAYFFLEAKRWLYSLILLPLLLRLRSRDDVRDLVSVAAAGVIWLAVKTYILAYIFSHGFIPLVYDIYAWMRLQLLGEITTLPSGFSRVFMQSQIFFLPAFFASAAIAIRRLVKNQWRPDRVSLIAAGVSALLFGAILTSLSRSFWVGAAAAVFFGGAAFLFRLRPSLRQTAAGLGVVICICLLGAALLFGAAKFPYPKPTTDIDASLLRDRATQMEAGAASRWSLLPVMWEEIRRSPIWGFGFGKTLTYYTSDPRVTQSTVDGEFTTYAFEWGWFDIWLKMGMLGLLAYAWLFWRLGRDAYILMKSDPVWGSTLFLSLIALAAVHFFTPYLNHPLGFIYLGAAMAALAWRRRA